MTTSYEYRESGSFVECADGTYNAVVATVEETTSEFGATIKFVFRLDGVQDNDGEAAELWGFCSAKLTSKAKLGRWASAILGRQLRIGERVSLGELVGKPCRVYVENVLRDGEMRPRIDKVLPAVPVVAPAAPEAESTDSLAAFDDETCVLCGSPVSKYLENGKAVCQQHAEVLTS
jgi:hypothetical protein